MNTSARELSPAADAATPKSAACEHCRNGFLDNRFGEDVECVNGVLIDIDVYFEGWQRDLDYPVAPCHPMWARQLAGDEDFPNDCQERLEANGPNDDGAGNCTASTTDASRDPGRDQNGL